ncbi:MAG: major capsid protein [Stackebrandtia sp.]
MLLNVDYYQPAELTGYARSSLADEEVNRFQLTQWLPSRAIDDLDYRFTKGGEGLTEAASFRSYDAESPVGSRPGVSRVTGELPPISRKIRLGEYDRLKQRGANAGIANGLLTDTERMVRAVAARIEVARGNALVDGVVELNENGVIATVDYGRKPEHSVAAAASWADPETDILGDMLTWRDTYVATNGAEPGAMVMSRTVLAYMLRNEAFRQLVGTMVGTPSIVSRSSLDAMLTSHDLPGIFTYDAQVKVDGENTRIIPNDVLLFLPAPTGDPDGTDLGATLWGTTAEALDPNYAVEEAPGIVAGAYSTQDPIAIWTKAAAIALPILANPDLSFKADVVP